MPTKKMVKPKNSQNATLTSCFAQEGPAQVVRLPDLLRVLWQWQAKQETLFLDPSELAYLSRHSPCPEQSRVVVMHSTLLGKQAATPLFGPNTGFGLGDEVGSASAGCLSNEDMTCSACRRRNSCCCSSAHLLALLEEGRATMVV